MKNPKTRKRVLTLSKSSRKARGTREQFLARRRAAVSAWRKLPKELERLGERLSAVLDAAEPRFAALDEPIAVLENTANTDQNFDAPSSVLEQLRAEIESMLGELPSDCDEQIACFKRAKQS